MQSPQHALIDTWLINVLHVYGVSPLASAKDWAAVGRLLDHGSSLKEVADVLRHRSLNTSLIYAKLDHPRLSAVALPWPGSAT